MNEQNRLRLERIAARHAKRAAGRSESEADPPHEDAEDTAFLAAFARVRDEVLRPVMAEIGVQLKASGYPFRISPGGEERAPAVDFQIVIPDRGDSKDTIRFFAAKDAARGWQVIAELELRRSPIELTRFEATEEIARDVAEQLIVDAVEQMFSSTGGAPCKASPPSEHAAELVSLPQPAPSDAGVAGGQIASGGPEPEPEPEPEIPSLQELKVTTVQQAHEAAGPALLPPLVDAPEMRWARWAGAQDVGGETAEVNVEALRRSLLPFVKVLPSPGFSPPSMHAAQVPPTVRSEEDDGHGTVMLQNVVLGPALRFVQPPHAGDASPSLPEEDDDGHETVMINRDAAFGPALPFMQSPTAGPPGKRLVRFDSQTGKPLLEPIWVDVPDLGKRER